MGKKIKASYSKTAKITPTSAETSSNTDNESPVFCFKYLDDGEHGLSSDPSAFGALLKRLKKLGEITWSEMKRSQRHGLGFEKIPNSQLKRSVPITPFITPDVDYLLVCRFSGKAPMAGLRQGRVFHLFFIDPAFTLYNH